MWSKIRALLLVAGVTVGLAVTTGSAPAVAQTRSVDVRIDLGTIPTVQEPGAVTDPPPVSCPTCPTVHGTIAWVKAGYSGMYFGPSLATGYGKVTFYNFHETDAHHWYGWLHYTNHNVNSAGSNAVRPAGAIVNPKGAQYGFCWPWTDNGLSGSGCWNDVFSWDWGKIIPVNNPGNVALTTKRQHDCASGALTYGNYITASRVGLGWLIAQHHPLAVTGQGYLIGLIQGCVVNIFQHW